MNPTVRLTPLTLAAVAACMTWTTAAAQSPNVQLYGLVDVGMTRVSGLRQGTVTQVTSGLMEGSRWGLKGTEDLGGGLKAIFTLEARLEADTGAQSNRPISGSQVPDRIGTPAALGLPNTLAPAVAAVNASIANQVLGVNLNNALFDRQAYLGLITPVGAVLAGRMYTPDYEVSAEFDAMQTQSPLAAGQLAAIPAGFDIRYSNAIQYRIQTGGLSASLMYGFGETGSSSSNSRFAGLMGIYKGADFAIGLGYNTRNNELGQQSLTTTTAGGWVNIGPGKLSAVYSRHRDHHPSNLSNIAATLIASGVPAPAANLVQSAYINALKQRFDLFNVGYRISSGPHTVTLAFTNRNEKTAYNADARSYGAAYTYAFSKRTDLNVVLVRFDNRKAGQAAPGGNGYLGGVTRQAGADSTAFGVSLRHRF